METDPDPTHDIIDDMVKQLFQLATDTLTTANNEMADLVTSGYGVDPQAFHDEATRLTMDPVSTRSDT